MYTTENPTTGLSLFQQLTFHCQRAAVCDIKSFSSSLFLFMFCASSSQLFYLSFKSLSFSLPKLIHALCLILSPILSICLLNHSVPLFFYSCSVSSSHLFYQLLLKPCSSFFSLVHVLWLVQSALPPAQDGRQRRPLY